MTCLLYLDLATKTGWAVGEITGRPQFGTQEYKTPARAVGELVFRYGEWVSTMVADYEVDIIAFEAPWVKNRDTTKKLIGITGKVEEIAFIQNMRCLETSYFDVMEWAHGNRSQKNKDPIFNAARERGYSVQNDDEADALMGWEFTAHKMWPQETPQLQSFAEINTPQLEGI